MLGNCYFYVKSIVIFTNMKYNKHICISVEGIISVLFLLTIWSCAQNYKVHHNNFSKLFHFSNNLKYKQYKKKQINPPIRIIAMKLIAEVKNCKANNDTKVSMISNAVINHHFGVVDFKGAQKDAMIKYYILYLESP